MKLLTITSLTLTAGVVGLAALGLRQLAVWFAEAIELGFEDLS